MKRVIPGIVMALAWGAVLFLAPPWLFWLVIVLGAAIGLSEYLRMTLPDLSNPHPDTSGQQGDESRKQQAGTAPGFHIKFVRLATLAVSLLPVLFTCFPAPGAVLGGAFAALFGLILLVFVRYSRLDDVLGFLSRAGLGVLYIGICAAHVVLLRNLPHGVSWLAVLTAVTVGSDTGAYYAGRRFGRTKLCPNISPGKTVAGAVGGLVAGSLAAALVAALLPSGPSPWLALVLGMVLVPVGIAGDLTESIIKRATGTKDSGTILAGHGGLLDRIDSLLLTAPVLYYLLAGIS